MPDHYDGLRYEAEAQNQVANDWITELLWASELIEGILNERSGNRSYQRSELMMMASLFLLHLHSNPVQGRIAAWAAEQAREELDVLT